MLKLIAALVTVACVVHGATIDERALFDSLAAIQQARGANVEDADVAAGQLEQRSYIDRQRRHHDWSNDRSNDWSHHRVEKDELPQNVVEVDVDQQKRHKDWTHDDRTNDWSRHHRRAEDVLPQNIDDPMIAEDDVQDVEGRHYDGHGDFSYDFDNSDIRGAPACSRCQQWYNTERTNMAWLTQVNREIPCPCTARAGSYGFTAVDKAPEDWDTDPVCSRYGRQYCRWYQPGADGCLQSIQSTSTGARQQCCYSAQGRLLAPTHRGAGTPDKASDQYDHQMMDLAPYKWCCMGCNNKQYCDKYLQVRKGSDAHCKAAKKP